MIRDGTLPRQRDPRAARSASWQRGSRRRSPTAAGRSSSSARVAGLRDHLRWFDARPLFGKRVLVTRSREQAGELVERLEDLGAEAIEAPTIAHRCRRPTSARSTTACAHAGTYDWIVFTSANGVDAFMRRLLAGRGDVRALDGPRLCAVGPGTAERLARYGLKVDLVPVEFRRRARSSRR